MSRPRTLSCTSPRSWPFSELIIAGPGRLSIRASCARGIWITPARDGAALGAPPLPPGAAGSPPPMLMPLPAGAAAASRRRHRARDRDQQVRERGDVAPVVRQIADLNRESRSPFHGRRHVHPTDGDLDRVEHHPDRDSVARDRPPVHLDLDVAAARDSLRCRDRRRRRLSSGCARPAATASPASRDRGRRSSRRAASGLPCSACRSG